MEKLFIILLVITLAVCQNETNNLKFPNDFLFGTATSAYQIEGAWNVSDKGESVWDSFVHKYPEKIDDRSNADVTCDSYHRYEDDMKFLNDLKVNHYRFSFSWSRLLPKGTREYVSKDGLRYYNTLLDELERRNITPFVTIYHWDHPQVVQNNIGGWLNESMAFLYADYAEFVFENFAHRVKYFVTVNEPQIFCTTGYGEGIFAPGLTLNGTGDYQCLHNMLKGHALAYHRYNKKFRSLYHGKLGMVMQCSYQYSANRSDTLSSDIGYEFQCGWQANPIYSSTGDYPKIMKDRVAERSKAQGYPTSRLPTFSEEWIKKIKGSADFLGLNYYTSNVVKPMPISEIASWPDDEGLVHSYDPSWPSSQSSWLKIVPEGLYDILKTIRNKYNNPVVYITENGVADGNGLDDNLRIEYLHDHLKVVLSAMDDGCNVKGYTVWSLLDDFEWSSGYTNDFGMIQVDFQSVNKTRTPKKSTTWYKALLRTRELPPINN